MTEYASVIVRTTVLSARPLQYHYCRIYVNRDRGNSFYSPWAEEGRRTYVCVTPIISPEFRSLTSMISLPRLCFHILRPFSYLFNIHKFVKRDIDFEATVSSISKSVMQHMQQVFWKIRCKDETYGNWTVNIYQVKFNKKGYTFVDREREREIRRLWFSCDALNPEEADLLTLLQ